MKKRKSNYLYLIPCLALLAGIFRYSVDFTWDVHSKRLLALGGLLFVLVAAADYRRLLEMLAERRARLRLASIISAILLIAVLFIINFLASSHAVRLDLTKAGYFSLSEQTKKVLKGLSSDISVVHFGRDESRGFVDLVGEYSKLNRRVRYEFVNPDTDPARARSYQVKRYDTVVVESDGRFERLYSFSEEALTSAIIRATRAEKKTICFAVGHGERRLADRTNAGLTQLAAALAGENYSAVEVNLLEAGSVPAYCSVLAVVGPAKEWLPEEEAALARHIEGSGRALLMLDPEPSPGFERLLARYGISVGRDIVIDTSGAGRNFGVGPEVAIVAPSLAFYGRHSITENFNLMTFYPLARTVSPAEAPPPDWQVDWLVKTGAQSFAETELRGKEASFDQDKDRKGPLALAVAASSAGRADGRQGKLVVFGDSDFVKNLYFDKQGNADLFLNAVNWLAEDIELIGVRARTGENRRVNLERKHFITLFYFMVLFLPLVSAVAGFYVWSQRRK